MLATIRQAWKIDDLRNRLLYTLLILIIFRVGVAMPVPFLSPDALSQLVTETGSLLGYFDMLTGGAFANSTLFALSVTPYIQASIIMNLLTVAIPALERLSKEGDSGRKKIQRITRLAGAILAFVMASMFFFLLRSQGALIYTTGWEQFFAAAVIVMSFTAGAVLIMWLGEQIDRKGVGSGISILIFAGIVSSFPSAVSSVIGYIDLAAENPVYYIYMPIIAILALAVVVFIVILSAAERRIPIQYAKKVVGRKMFGGQSTFIPIKVNLSGVMPVIFASSIVALPGTIVALLNLNPTGFWGSVVDLFNYNSVFYAVLYFLLIIAFNYFYVSMQYNPVDMANNLRKNNGTIPGIRPGKPTSDFIVKVLSKITFVGALFLGIVAVSPIIIGNVTQINLQLGGTSLLIVVGVALDTVRQIESYLIMRHHPGFLE